MTVSGLRKVMSDIAQLEQDLLAAVGAAKDEAALEAAIERLLAMPGHERAALGAQARAWFESNEASFAARLDAALRQLG